MSEKQEFYRFLVDAKRDAERACLLQDCRGRTPEDADCEKCELEMTAEYLIDHGVAIRKDAAWLIDGTWAECSNCHEAEKIETMNHRDYCPACGARMVVK